MEKKIEKAAQLLKKLTAMELADMLDRMEARDHIMRGLIFDEAECRNSEGFNRWLDDDAADADLWKYIK